MAVYRVKRILDIGSDRPLYLGGEEVSSEVQPGQITTLYWLPEKSRNKLVRCGAVHEVNTPPLSELPGWVLRSKKLEEKDVKTIGDLIDADVDTLAMKLGYSPRTIKAWKQSVVPFITFEPPSRK